jgi:hypothetical protein
MINQFTKSVTNRWKIKDISKLEQSPKNSLVYHWIQKMKYFTVIKLNLVIELINEHNVKIHGIFSFEKLLIFY